jgi:hypothetical protein
VKRCRPPSRPAIAGRGDRTKCGGTGASSAAMRRSICSTSCHAPPPPCFAWSSFSRRVFAPELWHSTVLNRHHRFHSVLHAKPQQAQMPVEAFGKRRLGRMTVRTERKKKIGGETPTDARRFCRGSGHGRAWIARRTSIGVPPRFSPQGIFHRKGRSLRPGFLGRGLSVERALPAPACPVVQRAPRTPVLVPRD